MSRAVPLVLAVAFAALFVYQNAKPPREEVAPPPPPAIELPAPKPVFTEEELQKIRKSLEDTDIEVRWAAAQLLYGIRDPQALALLDKVLAQDPDPQLRMRVVRLLRERDETARLTTLVNSLRDPDKDVRMAALDTLGAIGDPSVVTWITALLKDTEPEVRIAALRTLGRFQDRRKDEFRKLAEKLKKDYEEALRRSQLRR